MLLCELVLVISVHVETENRLDDENEVCSFPNTIYVHNHYLSVERISH
jgi:hypothetical protein